MCVSLPQVDVGAGVELAVSGGQAHTCALIDDAGAAGVRCWGSGASGRFGHGSTNNVGDGFATIWPCEPVRPNASNLNYRTGVDIANTGIVELSATGTICISTSSTSDYLVDVTGNY